MTITTRKDGMTSYRSLLAGGADRFFGGALQDIEQRIRGGSPVVTGKVAYRCREVVGYQTSS